MNKKKLKLFPRWILVLSSAIYGFIAIFISAKDIHLFPTLISIVIVCLLLLIVPYFIPMLSQSVSSVRIRKVLNWFSINRILWKTLVWVSSVVLLLLCVGGGLLAAFCGVSTKAPKALIPQLNWPFYSEKKIHEGDGIVDVKVYTKYKGKNDVVKITFDTRKPGAYTGWIVKFYNASLLQPWTKHSFVSFWIRSENDNISHLFWGLKDKNGREVKRELSKFFIGQPRLNSTQWRSIEINLTKLSSELQLHLDRQNLDNISFSLEHIDTDLTKDYVTFFVSELVFWEND